MNGRATASQKRELAALSGEVYEGALDAGALLSAGVLTYGGIQLGAKAGFGIASALGLGVNAAVATIVAGGIVGASIGFGFGNVLIQRRLTRALATEI